MELDLVEQIRQELNLRRMMNAGRNEPDRSTIRSSWQCVGFYRTSKNINLVTEWRH